VRNEEVDCPVHVGQKTRIAQMGLSSALTIVDLRRDVADYELAVRVFSPGNVQ
jgi:hypothetical protein